MRSPARIGLIVLALAIAVVGVGTVGIAFLPAAVTEPVVKPVTQSVELLTGDDKPETITVDFDEQPAALGISNYPHIQLGAMRYTTDSSLIDRASELLKGKTFKRWYGYASYRAKANDMVGGCHSSIELDTANGAKLCDVSYDPGYEGNEGPSIYIMDGDVAYVMEGDQTELNDFMGQCIQDAYKQTCLPDPQTARDSGSARTWLFEDEMPWTVESGSAGSALESPIVNPEDVFSIPKSEKLSAITLVATFAIIAPPIPRNRMGIILFCFTYFVLIISFKLFLESFI